MHVRATALIGASAAVNCSPASSSNDPITCAEDCADVQVSLPTPRDPSPSDNLHSSLLPLHSAALGPHELQPHTKPLLSFQSNSAAYDPTFCGIFRGQQQTQQVPLLPTSTILSSDPSYFEKMLKEWSHSISQQSHAAGAAAPASQPAVCPPSIFHIDVDDDVLCIESPKDAASDLWSKAHDGAKPDAGLVRAVDSDEIICVSSSDSDDESMADVQDARTPVLGLQAASSANSTGETNPPTYSVTPRGIMNFFSPITKPQGGAAMSSSGSSRASPSAAFEAMSSSAIPFIVNPVFTESHDEPATTFIAAASSPTGTVTVFQPPNQSYLLQLLSAAASNLTAVPEQPLAGDAETFSVVLSMISGRSLSVALPRALLQRSFTALLDETRAASPSEDQSPLVRRCDDD